MVLHRNQEVVQTDVIEEPASNVLAKVHLNGASIQRLKSLRVEDQMADINHLAQWFSLALPEFSRYREVFTDLTGPINLKKRETIRRERDIEWTEQSSEHWKHFVNFLESAMILTRN